MMHSQPATSVPNFRAEYETSALNFERRHGGKSKSTLADECEIPSGNAPSRQLQLDVEWHLAGLSWS